MCWSFLTHVRFLILLTVFELLPKTCNFTICSIFSNSGHVGWCTASPDTILKLDTLVMIQTKFGFHWSSTFRGEDFWKSLRRTTDDARTTDDGRRTTDDDDGRQVMRIAHMTLWVRWAKKDDISDTHKSTDQSRPTIVVGIKSSFYLILVYWLQFSFKLINILPRQVGKTRHEGSSLEFVSKASESYLSKLFW